MEYLGVDRIGAFRDSNSKISAAGKRVIVIGGGDTGCDCIGTALREGALSVISFEILDQPPEARDDKVNPWPNWPKVFRTDYGHEEVKVQRLAPGGKDPRIYNICSKEFVTQEMAGGGRKVAGIRTMSVKWNQGENGAWTMEEVPGSERVFEADLVLLALGFLGPESYLARALDIQLDPRSKVIVTSGAKNGGSVNYHVGGKIWTAGDCRRGQSLVVHAINEGRQAARAVDNFLRKKSKKEEGKGEERNESSALSTSGGIVLPPSSS